MKLIKGLNKDASKRSQPEGTYRDARNAVVNEELGALKRERGLKEKLDLGDFSIYGYVLLDEGDYILFLRDSGNVSEIVRWDGSTLTTIASDDINRTEGSDFSSPLDLRNPVQATYRSLANGDDVIYWTDGVNPPRFLNITQGVPGPNPSPDELNIFPEINTNPEFSLDQVMDFGGSLKAGSYHLAFAYVDQDESTTNYFLTAGPIKIPGVGGFGDDDETATRRAVQFTLSNLDTSYDGLRVALIKDTNVEILPDIPINDSDLTYTVTGSEDSLVGSLDEILIDRAHYETAQTLAQKDGTLYMGNLEARDRMDLQPYVNNIKVEAVPQKMPNVPASQDKAMTFPEMSFDYSTYKRGDVYALYISFLLEDGSETEAFHIPGRRGGSDTEKATASITIDGPAPNPTDAAASGTVTIQRSISPQGASASKDPLIKVSSDVSADDTFDVALYDDTGTEQTRVSVSVTSGDTADVIAGAIRDALNNDSTFSGDWTASITDQGNGVWSVGMTADQTGSSYNGWKIDIENDAGNFSYDNTTNTTEGGVDDTADAPDEDITLEWDEQGQSVTVTVTTLNGEDGPATVASKFVTALNNDSTISSNFTATDNGDGSFLIEADQNGKTYNGTFSWSLNLSKQLSTQSIDGGWDSANDNLEFDFRWSPKRAITHVSGISDGATAQQVADAIYNALQNNSSQYPDLTFSQSGTTITAEDQTNTAELNGDAPLLYNTPFTWAYSTIPFQGGGSTENAEAAIQFDGSAPEPSDGKASTKTIEANAIPLQGDNSEALVLEFLSGATGSDTFDAVLYDNNDQEVVRESINVTSSDGAGAIAGRVESVLESNSTFDANWKINSVLLDASSLSEWGTYLMAKNDGSQYNGYYIQIENTKDPSVFNYNNTSNKTSGGKDDDAPVGDHNLFFKWDWANETHTAYGSGLKGGDDKATVAAAYVQAINNHSTIGSNFTATDNGDGTFDIEAKTIGATYNGLFSITGGPMAYREFDLSGGWDGANDQFKITADFKVNGASVQVDVDPGEAASSMATKVYNALQNQDPDGGTISYFLEDSDTRIRARELSGTSDPNGKSPTVTSNPSKSWPATITDWSGGGATSASSTEKNEISDTHPLAKYKSEFGTIRNFHHSSSPDSNYNMGYWENSNETYPNDSRWDVKDQNGVVIDSYQGEPVRHHRMPEMVDEPYWDELEDDMYVLGLKLHDVHVPNEVSQDIVGYRLHYAKKDPQDRLIIDQSTEIHGWFDEPHNHRYAQHRGSVFQDELWTSHAWPYATDFDRDGELHLWEDIDDSLLQLHPFEALRRDLPISGATHIKLTGNLGYKTDESCSKPWIGLTPGDTIRALKGIAYIDKNQRDVNLTNLGFSHNYDNLFGESKVVAELENPLPTKETYLVDICQLLMDVHLPFENQQLVSTGYTGDISQSTSDVIFGGDVNISPWYFKAHSLLALASKDAWNDGATQYNRWWGWDGAANQEYELRDTILSDVKDVIFGDNINRDERDGLIRAIKEIIGNTSNIQNLPIAWGQLWYDLVESRDHPWLRTEGASKIETFKPASDQWVAHPDVGEMPSDFSQISNDTEQAYAEAKWIFQFFVQSDNWLKYNEEYSKLNDIKPPPPYRSDALTKTEFPTRVIRSAESKETGLRSAWRSFLANDHADLPRNRGDIMKIVPQGGNLIIHTEDALFRTRGRQEIAVGDERAFLGVGDIFSAPPQELMQLDEGYGGIADPREGLLTKFGYVFADKEARKIHVIGQENRELSNQGLRTWFRDNLDITSQVRMGYDPLQERLLLTDLTQGETLSFNPGLGWVSFHDMQPTRYLGSRHSLLCVQGGSLHEVGTGDYGSYGSQSGDFSVQFIVRAQQPDAEIPISLFLDALVREDDGTPVEREIFDSIQITNSYQDTGEVPLIPRVGEAGKRNPRHNIRKTDRIWKVNELRDVSNVPPGIRGRSGEWQHRRRLSDTFHEVKLVYGSTRSRTVSLYNVFLNRRPSRR